MNIQIKSAETHDQVVQLFEMTKSMAEVLGGSITLTIEDLKHYIDTKTCAAYIAYADNNAVGYTVWSEGFHTYDGVFMYVDDIFVDESYRQNGISKMLFSKLIEQATTNRYKNIEWLVEIDDEILQRWYDSLGSKPLSKYEYRRLSVSNLDS